MKNRTFAEIADSIYVRLDSIIGMNLPKNDILDCDYINVVLLNGHTITLDNFTDMYSMWKYLYWLDTGKSSQEYERKLWQSKEEMLERREKRKLNEKLELVK